MCPLGTMPYEQTSSLATCMYWRLLFSALRAQCPMNKHHLLQHACIGNFCCAKWVFGLEIVSCTMHVLDVVVVPLWVLCPDAIISCTMHVLDVVVVPLWVLCPEAMISCTMHVLDLVVVPLWVLCPEARISCTMHVLEVVGLDAKCCSNITCTCWPLMSCWMHNVCAFIAVWFL